MSMHARAVAIATGAICALSFHAASASSIVFFEDFNQDPIAL